MKPTTTYDVHGDRVLITLEVDAAAVTAQDGGRVLVTMDDEEWHDAAKRVLRERQTAERDMPADIVADRAERSLHSAVERAARYEVDPDLMRRRGAANILHRIADHVLSGTVRRFEARWDGANANTVRLETGRGDNARVRDMILAVEISKVPT